MHSLALTSTFESGEYARLLAIAYLTEFAVVPVSATLFLLERQGQELAWAGAWLLLTTAGPAAAGQDAPITAAIAALAAVTSSHGRLALPLAETNLPSDNLGLADGLPTRSYAGSRAVARRNNPTTLPLQR